MTRIYSQILNQLLKLKSRSLMLVGVICALAVVFGVSAARISTEYSLGQFQPTDDPAVSQQKQMAELFLIQNTSPYVISLSHPENQGWVQDEGLAILDQITEPLYEIEDIVNVVSLNTVPISVVTKNQLSVGTASEVTNKKDLLENRFLVPNLLSKDGTKTVLFIFPEVLGADGHNRLLAQINSIVDELPPSVTARIGGPGAASTSMSQLLTKEILFFSITSLLLAAIVLLVVFKGVQTPLISLFLTALANIFAIGTLSFLGISFSLLSNTLPVITTITTLALIIHSLSKLQNSKKDQRKNILSTFHELFEPHLLTALTTVIGFATLIPSKVPLIREFGLSVCIAVTVAATLTLFLLPALLNLIKIPETRNIQFGFDGLYCLIQSHRKKVIVSVGASAVVLFAIGQNLNWSAKVFDDLPKDHEIYKNTKFIDSHHGGSIALHLTIDGEEEGFWKKRENLVKLDRLQTKIHEFSGVGSVTTLNDFIKSSSLEKRIPKDPKSISEILFIYGMSSDNPIDQYLTPNQSQTRVSVRMKDIASENLLASNQKIFKEAEKLFPQGVVQMVGPAEGIHKTNRRISEELIFGFFHALFWIILVLSVVYRSISLALFSALPNLIPPSFLLGVLAITGVSIKPGIAIIFAISLGIAFDNTVYLLSKLKNRKVQSLDQIRQSFAKEAGACTLSSLVLACGFSIFIFSDFSMNLIFGSFMLVSIFSGLIGDLVLLPAVLFWRPRLLNFSFTHGILLKVRRNPVMKPLFSKVITSIAIIVALSFVFQTAEAGTLTAKKILDKVQKNNIVPNELVELKMTIKERDGSTKVRELIVKKKNGNKKMSLVKLQKPADLKGVGLLNVSESQDDESQWLFLPSEKRSRRLASSNKGGNFLDSDLSYEDMSISTYQSFTNKLEKTTKIKGRNIAIIKSVAKSKDDSSYGKIRTWVDTNTSQVLKANYYNHKGKLVKKILFKDYKRYGKIWRAHTVTVKNIVKKRSTVLQLKRVSLKKISTGELSMSALEEV